eukprot:sb/3466460/
MLGLEFMEAIEDVVVSKSGTVDFIVREEKVEGVKELLRNKFGLNTIQLLGNGNVKKALENVSEGEDSAFSYTAYHRLGYTILIQFSSVWRRRPHLSALENQMGTIYNYLEAIANQYPDIVELFTLTGKTYEGREIKAVKISKDVSNSDSKPLLWIDGGIHAREWISPATVMYIIDALVGNHETNLAPKIGPLLDKYQFVIAPCINPDGYEFTHTTKRRIKLYVTYHSYSQLFLLPLGYTKIPPPDHEHHTAVGKAVVAAIKERYGTEYTPMISAGLYPASGDSADWAYHALSISDAYTFELRDTGKHGFVLPPEQIVESGGENVDGLLALIDNLATDNK